MTPSPSSLGSPQPPFRLLVGGEEMGGVTDIDGPTATLDLPDSDEVIPTYRGGDVTFTVSPWHIPDSLIGQMKLRQHLPIVIRATMRQAWWNRLGNWLYKRQAPIYTLVKAQGSISGLNYCSGGPHAEFTELGVDVQLVGPVETEVPPYSRLERIWMRLCMSVKR